jgi:hypothetical protein
MGARLEGKGRISRIHVFEVMGQTAGSVCRCNPDACKQQPFRDMQRRRQSEGLTETTNSMMKEELLLPVVC